MGTTTKILRLTETGNAHVDAIIAVFEHMLTETERLSPTAPDNSRTAAILTLAWAAAKKS